VSSVSSNFLFCLLALLYVFLKFVLNTDLLLVMEIMEENDDENPLDVYPIGVFTSYD
jgi:hypothetical protein